MRNKGITLVALVVSIIIMLILAGVTLNIALGENGLFKMSEKTVDKYKEESEEEQRQLTMAEATMNLNGTKYKSTYNGEEVTVPIPAGFAVSQVDGENTVEDGLVIIDSEGNEFVWIPVKKDVKYEMNEDYEIKAIFDSLKADEDYLPSGLNAEGLSEEKLEEKLVRDAGGFYVGRYEAGAEEAILIKNNEGNPFYWSNEPKLVCKKGAEVYCCINQTDSKIKSKTFVDNDNVKSGLITSIQWDMIMNLVNGKKDGNGNVFDVNKPIESRHIGTLLKCGQNNADKVYNIYDLESNYNEWVAQRSNFASKQPAIFRGSASTWKINGEVVAQGASRHYFHADEPVNWYSFRFVLYLI